MSVISSQILFFCCRSFVSGIESPQRDTRSLEKECRLQQLNTIQKEEGFGKVY